MKRFLPAGLMVTLFCCLAFIGSSPSRVCGEDWPQWMGPHRDGVWRERGILRQFPDGGPRVLWRVAIEGGYAGPAVAEGRVFVTDYAAPGDRTPDPGRRNELRGAERVLCLDARSGAQLWKFEYPCDYKISYPAGPRATPLVHEGKVYTLGAEGDLHCLRAENGEVLWSRSLKKDYDVATPIWGFTGHPLINGERLICLVGGQGSVVVAFHKETGEELWRSLSAQEPGYSPPTMIETGAGRQLVVWHPEAVNGLDPKSGQVRWTVPLTPDYGMSIMAPQQFGDLLFVGGVGTQAVLLRLAADGASVEEVWRGTRDTALYPVCATPLIADGYLYGCCNRGEFRGVKLETGERLWDTYAPTTGADRGNSGTAFLVKNDEVYFLMSETGHLIIARLNPEGYEELGRAKLLEPTGDAFGRAVVWSHPAFANRCIFARNDKELICVSLAEE
jgi:outer membrane protein assembly factor BamB